MATRPSLTSIFRQSACAALMLIITSLIMSASAGADSSGFHADLRLASPTPDHATGAILNLTRPDLPNGKPKTETVGVFTLPRGTHVNLDAVPACTKDDTTLQIEGTLACPQSFIGTGYVTLYSGFGPPIDPIALDQHWYYAPNQLVQLVTAHGTTTPVIKVLRVAIKGATFSAELSDLPPGWPPGTTMAPKVTDLTINNYVGPHGAFLTTPRRCPRSGKWTSSVKLYYSDHTTDTITDAASCERRSHNGRTTANQRRRHRHHRSGRH